MPVTYTIEIPTNPENTTYNKIDPWLQFFEYCKNAKRISFQFSARQAWQLLPLGQEQ